MLNPTQLKAIGRMGLGLAAASAALVGLAWAWVQLARVEAGTPRRAVDPVTRAEDTFGERALLMPFASVPDDGPAPSLDGAAIQKVPAAVSAAPSATPPAASRLSELSPAVASAATSAAAPVEDVEPAPPPERTRAKSPRLSAWTQPGLCSENLADAERVRRDLRKRFRSWDGGELGRLLLDPRLRSDAETLVGAQLVRARQVVAARLELEVPLPEVFVYADTELLRASACVNGEVAAFYDGALHVVANDRDLAASVTHELAHHAMMSAGLRGPAWAQEGIAMHAAGERWWRERARLGRLSIEALALEAMEEAIPYKLPKDQAVVFYVQAAAMVECALVRQEWTLDRLIEALRDSIDIVDDVRELAEPALLERCLLER